MASTTNSTTSIRDLGLKVGSRIDTNRGTAVVVRVIDLDGQVGGLVDCRFLGRRYSAKSGFVAGEEIREVLAV